MILKNNLIYIKLFDNYLGFLDTGGGMTFQFRHPELNSKLKFMYREELSLDFLSKKVIVFFGNDYWINKIYLFDYIKHKFNFINKIPKHLTSYKMINNKLNYALINLLFEDKNEI